METLRPIIDSLVAWPTDVLRPSAPLWERLAQRIAEETGRETAVLSHARSVQLCQLLATDADKRRVTMLVRLAPGAEYPPHRHAGVEELHLLHGEVIVDDRTLYPGTTSGRRRAASIVASGARPAARAS